MPLMGLFLTDRQLRRLTTRSMQESLGNFHAGVRSINAAPSLRSNPVLAAASARIIHGNSLALRPGTRLGPYEILSALGAGGMGEVYRATRHEAESRRRDQGPARSLRELTPSGSRGSSAKRKSLASLNHPNIAAIHGLEESGGVTRARDGAGRGRGPRRSASRAGRSRSTKRCRSRSRSPRRSKRRTSRGSSIAISSPRTSRCGADGTVKVLDFGLAKAMEPAAVAAPNVSQSPTITTPAMTQAGMILGTAAYMSPEQAKGRAARQAQRRLGVRVRAVRDADRAARVPGRGRVRHARERCSKSEPDWNALPSNVPPAVRALIQGCLRKDRKERIGDISTALFLLGQPQEQAALVSRPLPSPVWRRAMLVVAAVLISAAIAATVVWQLRPLPAAPGDSIRVHPAGGTAS